MGLAALYYGAATHWRIKMPVEVVCEVCGKNFNVPPSRAKTAKTCSTACAGARQAKAYAAERVNLMCAWCGTEFSAPKSHAHRRKHCSKECADAAITGAKAPRVADGAEWAHTDGYVLEVARTHPFAVGDSVLQHRLVVEQWMREEAPSHAFLIDIDGAKYLRREIAVHHRNEDKRDNRRENLVACTNAAHRDIHDGRTPMRGAVWPEAGNEIAPESRKVGRSCEQCGAAFYTKRSAVKRGSGKFCSRVCYDASRYQGDLPATVAKRCLICGEEFHATRNKSLIGAGKYCSNACRYIAQRGIPPSAKR